MEHTDAIGRRTVIERTAALTGLLALAGCTSGGSGDGDEPNGERNDGEGNGGDSNGDDAEFVPEFIEIENPPDAVYVPTHREAMRMLEPIETGDVAIAPMLSYPHPFWIVAGGDEGSVQRVDPEATFGVHMMFTVWDRETGIVLPVDDGATVTLYQDGEQVGTPFSPWTMISQEMGFHFGDNVPLSGDGTYTAEIELPTLSTRKTGALEGRLTEPVTATFEFVYDDEFRHEVVGGVEYLDEEYWGRRGALEPMDHGDDGDHGSNGDHDDHNGHDDHNHHVIPYSSLPEIGAYPGTVLVDPDEGTVPERTQDLPSSGDARFLATAFESDHRLAEEDGEYLLVSPRTPYNRVPLADMSVRATIERDGELIEDVSLVQTIDGEFDVHYGASVSDVQPGDSVTIEIETPPQVARHRGYETAFLEMPPVELEVPTE